MEAQSSVRGSPCTVFLRNITSLTYVVFSYSCMAEELPRGSYAVNTKNTKILKYENTKLRLNKRKIHLRLMSYELKTFSFKTTETLIFVSLMNLGKELKIFVPRKKKTLCPVMSLLHLGNERSQPRSQGFSPPRRGRAPFLSSAEKSPGNEVGKIALLPGVHLMNF